DVSASALAPYDRAVDDSFIVKDLKTRRNMRTVFHKAGFYLGGIQAALMTVTGGAFPGGRVEVEPDAEVPRRRGTSASGSTSTRPPGNAPPVTVMSAAWMPPR